MFTSKCMLGLSLWLLSRLLELYIQTFNSFKLTSLECSRRIVSVVDAGTRNYKVASDPFPIYKRDRVVSWNDLRV